MSSLAFQPFGVWRNKSKDPRGSNSKAGITNYDDLYADILLWLEKGWIDYVGTATLLGNKSQLCRFQHADGLVVAKHVWQATLYIGHGIYRTFEARKGAWKTKT